MRRSGFLLFFCHLFQQQIMVSLKVCPLGRYGLYVGSIYSHCLVVPSVFLAFVVTSLYPIQFFAQPLILVYISEGSFFLYLIKDKLFNSEERIYPCIILINRIFIEHNFFKTVFNMQTVVLPGR